MIALIAKMKAAAARAKAWIKNGGIALVAATEKQLADPALHRFVVLGLAAYLLRKFPFLDQDTAEKLSDGAGVAFALALSKMPGAGQVLIAPKPQPAADPGTPDAQ